MNTRKIAAVLSAALLAALAFSACPSPDDGTPPIANPSFIEMVQIPGGTFQMGSPTTEPNRWDDETQHTVTVTSFWMGKYEVTQGQYQTVIGSLPSDLPSDSYFGVGNNYPVYCVSWYDAIVFCNRLSMREGLSPAYRIDGSTNPTEWGSVPTSSNVTWNAVEIVAGSNGYRLPTEAQWEYACRAGSTAPWHTASRTDRDLGNYAWYDSNSNSRTHEVGRKFPNEWGLYDMHGNVYEWCWDWYGAYTSAGQTDPTGAASGTNRVERGGSWLNDGRLARSASRDNSNPFSGVINLGFRLVRP